MSNQSTIMELPSITKKKADTWAEMENLYTSSYNGLTTAVATVGTVISMVKAVDPLPDSIDMVKLTVMVDNLNKNINRLRESLNSIHAKVQTTKNIHMDMIDVNMESIQIASNYHEWSLSFHTLCSQPLNDIINYVEG